MRGRDTLASGQRSVFEPLCGLVTLVRRLSRVRLEQVADPARSAVADVREAVMPRVLYPSL